MGFIEAVEGDSEVASVAGILSVGSVQVVGRDGLMDLEHELGGTSLEPFLRLGCPFLLAAHPQISLEQFRRCDVIRGHAGGHDVIGDEVADGVAFGQQALDPGTLLLCHRECPALFQFTL